MRARARLSERLLPVCSNEVTRGSAFGDATAFHASREREARQRGTEGRGKSHVNLAS